MFELFSFIILVVLVFWIASVSNRLSVLERKIALGKLPSAPLEKQPERVFGQPQTTSIPQTISSAPSPAQVVKPQESQEQVAANWLTKIGVVALLLGVAFFIKYAIDQNWIGQWMRIILGLGIGGLLVVLGVVWREKYTKYASVLTGGGIAILYFSIYASYDFYKLVPQPVAFVFMLAVTVLAIGLAFKYESAPLAVLGVAGAYLSPVLLHSGRDQQINLFIYLTVLNVAALIVLAKRYWVELLYVCFFGTILDFILWGSSYSNKDNTSASFIFTLLTFAIFILGAGGLFRLQALKGNLKEKAASYFAILSVFAAIFYCSSISILLNENFHSFLGLAGLAGAVIVLMAYVFVDRLQFSQINYTLAFIATAFLVLAAVWQYNYKTLDLVLIVLGLVGIATGVWIKHSEFRVMGLLILIATAFLVLTEPYDFTKYTFILNSKFGLVFLEVLALWFTGWIYGRTQIEKHENNAANLASAVGVLLLWIGFSWELSAYFRSYDSVNARNLLLSLWWIACATGVIIFGSVTRNSMLRKLAILFFILSILKVFLYDVQALDMGYRIVSFIVLGVILLSVSFAYQKNKEKISAFLEGEKEGIIPKL